jgi:hypothetical protein
MPHVKNKITDQTNNPKFSKCQIMDIIIQSFAFFIKTENVLTKSLFLEYCIVDTKCLLETE